MRHGRQVYMRERQASKEERAQRIKENSQRWAGIYSSSKGSSNMDAIGGDGVTSVSGRYTAQQYEQQQQYQQFQQQFRQQQHEQQQRGHGHGAGSRLTEQLGAVPLHTQFERKGSASVRKMGHVPSAISEADEGLGSPSSPGRDLGTPAQLGSSADVSSLLDSFERTLRQTVSKQRGSFTAMRDAAAPSHKELELDERQRHQGSNYVI